jgi:hypothetical protein
MEATRMLKPRYLLVVALAASVALSGCEAGRRFVRKPWGKGTYIPAAVCAVVGGFAGAAIESQGFSNESIRSGSSCVTDLSTGIQVCKHDGPDYPAAAAIGAGAGAVTAKVVDLGVPDEWVNWFRETVQPDTATVVLLVDSFDQDALVAEASRFAGAHIVYANLDPNTLKRVTEAFETGSAT